LIEKLGILDLLSPVIHQVDRIFDPARMVRIFTPRWITA
jgi:hypothetical protein